VRVSRRIVQGLKYGNDHKEQDNFYVRIKRGLNSFQAVADISFSGSLRLPPTFIGKEILNAMSYIGKALSYISIYQILFKYHDTLMMLVEAFLFSFPFSVLQVRYSRRWLL